MIPASTSSNLGEWPQPLTRGITTAAGSRRLRRIRPHMSESLKTPDDVWPGERMAAVCEVHATHAICPKGNPHLDHSHWIWVIIVAAFHRSGVMRASSRPARPPPDGPPLRQTRWLLRPRPFQRGAAPLTRMSGLRRRVSLPTRVKTLSHRRSSWSPQCRVISLLLLLLCTMRKKIWQ